MSARTTHLLLILLHERLNLIDPFHPQELEVGVGLRIRPESLREMCTPSRSARYALGIRVGEKNGRTRYSHFGAINGFGSFIAYFPATDVTIVVLSNVAGDSAALLEEKLEDIYFGQ